MSRTHVTCTINGDEVEFLCDDDESLLNALRDEVGLTGAKEGCGTGDCGSCSIILDGRLTCSCLVFAPEAAALVNPVLATEESIARGKAVYTIHCQVCHGADGMANPAESVVTKRMTESGAPPFPLATTVAYTDGMIFTKIRYGKPLMPGYPQISPEDRWHVVDYLRVLFKVP